jgi:hypothetical protein
VKVKYNTVLKLRRTLALAVASYVWQSIYLAEQKIAFRTKGLLKNAEFLEYGLSYIVRCSSIENTIMSSNNTLIPYRPLDQHVDMRRGGYHSISSPRTPD